MASAEETEVFATIARSINDLHAQFSERASVQALESEAEELLAFIPEVLGADEAPARLESLLFHTDPPAFPAVLSLTHPHIAVSRQLRASARRTLTHMVASTAAVASKQPTSVSQRMTDRLLDVTVALRLFEDALALTATIPNGPRSASGGVPVDVVAAVELLFALPMQLPATRPHLAAASALPVVLAALPSAPDTDDIRAYLCGVLQFLCDADPASLSDPELHVLPLLAAILHAGGPPQVVALLLDVTAAVLAATPGLYVAVVCRDPALLGALATTLHRLLEDSSPSVAAAAITVASRVLALEGASAEPLLAGVGVEPQGLRALLASSTAWRHAVRSASGPEPSTRLLMLQCRVLETAFCREHTAALVQSFMEAFPALCAALDPEKSTGNVMQATALAIALMAAKSIAARDQMAAMVTGYDAWAANLRGTAHECIAKMASARGERSPLYGMDIVDGEQCVLNDAGPLIAAGLAQPDLGALSSAIFAEQQRRARSKAPPVALPDRLVHPAHAAQDRATLALSEALGFAVLHRALDLALTPPSADPSALPARTVGVDPKLMASGSGRTPDPADVTPPRPQRHVNPKSPPASAARAQAPRRSASAAAGRPVKRPPFRPSSTNTRPQHGTRTAATPLAPPLLHQLQTRGNEEYVTTAIMMHLPMRYGIHYQRDAKARVRRITGPAGNTFVQKLHRGSGQSWTAADVQEGDLYVLFVPFHKLTPERLAAEIKAVESHLHRVKKLLVTTPQQQRARRWLLHDLLNYVLPKTELMLRELYQVLQEFNCDDVVYQMGVIRLTDLGRRDGQDVVAVAAEESDVAMPEELLRFGSGRLKDVLHSGNLAYALERLKRHYYADEAEGAEYGAPTGHATHLRDIDAQIHDLQARDARDTWDAPAGVADAEDDVEGMYDRAAAHDPLMSPDRYAEPDALPTAAPSAAERAEYALPSAPVVNTNAPLGAGADTVGAALGSTAVPVANIFEEVYATVEGGV